MTESRLRTFVALADTGSVRAAAEHLYVTESAVSASVSALARELGVPLVERAGRGIVLTPAGRVYAGYARKLLGLHEEARAAARGEHDPGAGRLRLAAVTTAADQVLPELLADFRRAWPRVELALEVGPSRRIWAALEAHGETMNPLTARYVNRLSDLLFIFCRVVSAGDDVLWRPGG